MTRQLSELSGTEFLVRTAGRQLEEIFGGEVVVYLREPDGTLALRFGEDTSHRRSEPINATSPQWVADNGKLAGAGTDTLPNATALFVPLVGSQRTVGASASGRTSRRVSRPRAAALLETCASLIALSIERDRVGARGARSPAAGAKPSSCAIRC